MNHMTQNPLLIIAVVCIFPSVVHGITEYYVKPTESTVVSCPGEPCHIFDHYLSNVDHYTWSNVAIIFLPGSHSMNQSLHIISSDSVQLISFHLPTTTVDMLKASPGYLVTSKNASVHSGLPLLHMHTRSGSEDTKEYELFPSRLKCS